MIQPVNDRIVIQPEKLKEEEVRKGNIILPKGIGEISKTGIVIEVGRGRVAFNGTIIPLVINKGDKVVYNPYGATEVRLSHNEDPVVVVSEDDVIAIIK